MFVIEMNQLQIYSLMRRALDWLFESWTTLSTGQRLLTLFKLPNTILLIGLT